MALNLLNIVIKPPLCSFALRLINTKVPVWTHGSIGYPKMDISHWDAAINYGIKLAQYCDQTRSCKVFHRDRPLYAHLPYDSETSKHLCGLMSP